MPSSPGSPFPRVVLVGGAPLSGKSTLARLLGPSLGYDVVCTDDLSAVARAVTTPASHPALHPMAGLDYRAYYVERFPDVVWQESLDAHAALWPAIRTLVDARASYGHPAVIEGWALLPALVSSFDASSVRALYVVIDPGAYDRRVRALEQFWRGAEDERALRDRFADRSKRFDAFVRAGAVAAGHCLLEARESDPPEELCRRARNLLAQALLTSPEVLRIEHPPNEGTRR